jgi:hypothetical protein
MSYRHPTPSRDHTESPTRGRQCPCCGFEAGRCLRSRVHVPVGQPGLCTAALHGLRPVERDQGLPAYQSDGGVRMSDTPIIHPPERYRAIIDAVSQRDREYFEAHPWLTTYRRQAIPGEFWPIEITNIIEVEVNMIAPGFRTRRPIGPCWDGGET